MGYTTEFKGHFTLSRPATEEEKHYINTLSETRRMKRDISILQKSHKGKYGFNGDYGVDGEYFIGGGGIMGQNHDASVIDGNTPPGQLCYESDFENIWKENEKRIKEGKCQPGLWLKWEISEDGTKLEWNGAEKFYYYKEWLKYLIERFFSVWNIKLNGDILYQGEELNDNGNLLMVNNKLYVNMTMKDIRKIKLDNINIL